MFKIFNKIFILSIFILSSCTNWYIDFHKNKSNSIQQNLTIQDQIQSFSLDKIYDFEKIDVRITPDKKLLDELAAKIDKANSRVYLESYIFTEKRIRKSLIDAKKRWLDVKVIMEKNIYMAWNLNRKTFDELSLAWIWVVYSNVENYALNHTKMLIIDDEVIISTWNYSFATFNENREFFVFINDNKFLLKTIEIFDLDFKWIKWDIYDDNLVLSPNYTRNRFDTLLNNAQKSIKMYSQNFWDEKVLNLLIEKSKSWIKVQMIFPSLKKLASNIDEIEKLEEAWVEIKILEKPYVHAKSILVDDKFLYLWSINFSTYSIEKNREVWVLIKDKNVISKFGEVFTNDIKK